MQIAVRSQILSFPYLEFLFYEYRFFYPIFMKWLTFSISMLIGPAYHISKQSRSRSPAKTQFFVNKSRVLIDVVLLSALIPQIVIVYLMNDPIP